MADYLEDRGEDGQAEFIRLSCKVSVIRRQIETLPYDDRCHHEYESETYLGCRECEFKEEMKPLGKRLRKLLTASAFWSWFCPHGTPWGQAWPGTPGAWPAWSPLHKPVVLVGYGNGASEKTWTLRVERGFIDSVSIWYDHWKKWGGELLKSCPVRLVELYNATPYLEHAAYFWCRPGTTPRTPAICELPGELIEGLAKSPLSIGNVHAGDACGPAPTIRVYFRTRDEATTALSDVLLLMHTR
jgi:hypothetical protein